MVGPLGFELGGVYCTCFCDRSQPAFAQYPDRRFMAFVPLVAFLSARTYCMVDSLCGSIWIPTYSVRNVLRAFCTPLPWYSVVRWKYLPPIYFVMKGFCPLHPTTCTFFGFVKEGGKHITVNLIQTQLRWSPRRRNRFLLLVTYSKENGYVDINMHFLEKWFFLDII